LSATPRPPTSVDWPRLPWPKLEHQLANLLAGQVQVLFDNIPGSIGHIKNGKVRALGVTGSKRVAAIPDVPTIGETVPGYEVSIWYGIAAPRGTPPKIVEKLNQAVNAVLGDPKLQARLAELGGEPMPMTPAQFGKLVAEETERWGKLIRAANIKAE
jgi:tripartite-type tricarboxylate transporter receptor subunit TctC